MTYTYICPTCLARQGAPAGGKLVSQEIGGYLTCRRLEVVFVYRVGVAMERGVRAMGGSGID